MRQSMCAGWARTFVTVLALAFSALPARSHGGGYPGGGGSIPGKGNANGGTWNPGSGGGGGGGGPPGPGGPGPGSPTKPGDIVPSGPSTPAPAGPTKPPEAGPAPSGPASGGGPQPGAPQPGGAPAGGGPQTFDVNAIDWTSWELWWNYNRHRFVDVRSRMARGFVTTGDDEFYLGRGQDTAASDLVQVSDQRLAAALVPLLVATLKSDASQDVLSSATIALAKARRACKLAGVRAAEHIAPLLAHSNLEVSETAAVALGILGRDSDLELLQLLLADERAKLRETRALAFESGVPMRVRAFAAFGLGTAALELDGYQALVVAKALRDGLERELRARGSDEVAAACVTALGVVPLPFAASDPELEFAARTLLASRQDAVRHLMNVLERPEAGRAVRAQVPTAVARLMEGAPAAHPLREKLARTLLELAPLKATDEDVRRSAILALGQLGGTSAATDELTYAALIAAARSASDLQSRCFAWIALGEASGRGTFDGKRDVALGALVEAMSGGSSELRAWSALALALQQRLRRERSQPTSEDAAAALRLALSESRSPTTSGAYALALGILGDARSSEVLLARLDEESDPQTKGHLCVALGLVGAREAASRIEQIARAARYQPELLGLASIGLGLLADRQRIATLIELLEGSTSLATQAGLASALGRIGDPRAVEPLLSVAESTERPQLLRAFAIVALGSIADERARPWNEPLARGINYRAAKPTLASPADARGVLDIL